MRLTWIFLAMAIMLAVAGCSETEPPATFNPTPGTVPTAAPGQVAQPAKSASPTKPAAASQAPTPAAHATAAPQPKAEPTVDPTPSQGTPTPAPVAEPIPELVPAQVPTPAAATVSPLPEFVPATAVPPEDIYDFTSVSAGYEHSCGLRSDGRILCWGDGRNGETEPPEGTFSAVSAGDGYTCGLRTDGSVTCWGIWGITYGMPVYDTSTHRWAESPTGVFKSIATGNAHACGIKADDTIHCWGENRVSAGDFSREVGQATAPPGTFRSISSVGSTNCAVTTENQVVCWGAGYEGAVSTVEGQFLSVSAGHMTGCGVTKENQGVCWGDDTYGQVTAPTGRFASVSVGQDSTCGVQMSGRIECWGAIRGGDTPPNGKFRSVSVAASHICAVHFDGAIACWGYDFGYDTLGLQAGITCGVLPTRALACPEDENYKQLAAIHASDWVHYYYHDGSSYPCGNRADGTVVCWDPSQESFAAPVAREVLDFSAGDESACWLLPDKTVGCWDGNQHHACVIQSDDEAGCWDAIGEQYRIEGAYISDYFPRFGDRTKSCEIRPDDSLECWNGLVGLPGTFQSVSVGASKNGDFYCGVRKDGKLACSGTGEYGETSPPDGKFKSVSAGWRHACGVRVDSSVACWGSNTDYWDEVLGQTEAPPGQFLSVSAGHEYTCGIRTDQTLACWGRVPDVLKNLSGIKPPPLAQPLPTPTPDIWLLPLRDQMEWAKQQPGPLATNILNLGMIYRIVGMMTEAEKEAMVEETELLIAELGPPTGKARARTFARIWLDLIEAFGSSLDDFNHYRSISEFRLKLPFYVFLPEYLPPGFRNGGVGVSGGRGWGEDASSWTIHFERSSEWYPQIESGTYERITFIQGTNEGSGNPFRDILPQLGGGKKIVVPNLEAAGADDVRYWLGYSDWGVGGKDSYYQVAWEDPEADSFTHVISSLSLEETLKVVGSLR